MQLRPRVTMTPKFLPGISLGAPFCRAMTLTILACGFIAFVSGCGELPAPPAPSALPAAQVEAPAAEFMVISIGLQPDVVVRPASSVKLPVEIDRPGDTGEVKVTFGPAPEGIVLAAESITEGSRTGTILITADERLGDAEVVAAISMTASVGEVTAGTTLNVTVPKQEPPQVAQPSEFVLQPGMKAKIPLQLEWNGGLKRPVSVAMREVEGESNNDLDVMATPLIVEQPGDALELALEVSEKAKDGGQLLPLEMTFMGQKFPIDVRLRILRRPFTISELRAVWLVPGESQTVSLPMTRLAHDGAIEITITGLPEGVTATTNSLAPGDTEVIVELRAAEDAEPRVRSAFLTGKAGDIRVDNPLVVRVRPASGDTSLPPAVFAGRDASRLIQRGSIGGRISKESKESLSELYGGTTKTEAAIRRGLAWLARTQQPDGSWTLQGSAPQLAEGIEAQGEGDAPQPNATAATAFGILPFLGEGITHKRAPDSPLEFTGYKTVVENGLVFLASHQVRAKGPNDGYFGGSMYAHCLATIAFCEAYGLTRDERTRFNAKQGIKYLLAAQDPEGGGWRYSRGQRGDLSVTGWVVIALRSAQLANISVPMKQIRQAEKFLESVVGGPDEAPRSRYRYEFGKPETKTMTAAGLLSRLYLGWSKEEPDLVAGRDYLMEQLPPAYAEELGPLYFYYYATQVLHHLEGEDFDIWNHRMREHLLRLQRVDGELEGSWDPRGSDRGKTGGRMYSTALSLLTLQVYYRHLPMFREVNKSSSTDDDSDEIEQSREDDADSAVP